MIIPPPDPEEGARLEALRSLRILDTPPEDRFDRITRVAARLFQVPMALVSLVDAERQWFKARQGLEVCETARDISFCGHAILSPELLAVPDALQDPRFADNPLVTGPPCIRFYAGIPLSAPSGHRLGTLCILDRVPRAFPPEDRAILRDLGAWAERELGANSRNRPDGEHRHETIVAALEASNAFRRTLFEAAGSSIIATDPEGMILAINPAGERLLGWAAEELVGRESPALIHDPEEIAQRALELSRELGKEIPAGFETFVAKARLGQPETRDWTYIRKDGTRFPVTLTVSAIWDSEGGLKGFVGIASDISALRSAEGELRLMAEVTRRMDNGVVLTDPLGRITWVNEGFTRISGYTLEEVRGRSPGSVLQGSETSPEEISRIREAVRNREGFTAILLNYRKSGEPYWVEISTQPLKDRLGRLTGFMGLQRDITHARRAEEALRASEERSRALLDALPDRVYRLRRDGTVLDASVPPESPGILPREGLVGRNLLEFLPSKLRSQARALALSALEEGKMAILEYRLDSGSGPRDFEARCVPIGAEEVVTVVRDITARKASERMKDEFISTVSHELRTPLTAIKGSLGLLAGGATGPMGSTQLSMIHLAYRNVERLARLVNDLLDLQKMDSGRLTFDLRVHPLGTLSAQAVQAMAPFAEDRAVSLRLEAAPSPLFARVDADRFQQILANLLSNAIKFSPERSEVRLSLSRRDAWARLEVWDQGPGIPETFRPRLFEKFAQADTGTMRAQGGTGLGLSIVKTLTEHMNGHVGFQSEIGSTVFFVELPLCNGEDES